MARILGRLGKASARPRPKDIHLAEIVAPGTTLKQAPVGFGHAGAVAPGAWGLLGNANWGDCVWAGADHETIMVNAMNGRTVTFTDANALSDYSAVTGFDPSDPSTDQGTDVHDAMNYRRKTGVIDVTGARHRIGAFVSLEAGNWAQMLETLYAFDFVAIGFQVPDYAMAQFQNGKHWTYHRGGTIEGGHYVPVVSRPHAWSVEVVTWGTLQYMSRKFYEELSDEAYAVLTPETLSKSGQRRTPEGLDLATLNGALATL